jgi:hypothetical protein
MDEQADNQAFVKRETGNRHTEACRLADGHTNRLTEGQTGIDDIQKGMQMD